MDISARLDESSESWDDAERGPTTVSGWKREINGKVFMFTAVQRGGSTWVNVSEVITTYEPLKSVDF